MVIICTFKNLQYVWLFSQLGEKKANSVQLLRSRCWEGLSLHNTSSNKSKTLLSFFIEAKSVLWWQSGRLATQVVLDGPSEVSRHRESITPAGAQQYPPLKLWWIVCWWSWHPTTSWFWPWKVLISVETGCSIRPSPTMKTPSMGRTGFLPRVLSLFAVNPRLGISDWSSILLISIVYQWTLCTAPSGLYLWISELLFFLSNSLDLTHQKICISRNWAAKFRRQKLIIFSFVITQSFLK